MRSLLVHLAGIGFLGLATPAAATHLFVQVDPITGSTTFLISAGVVQSPVSEGPSSDRPVMPTQQLSLDAPSSQFTLGPESTAQLIAQSISDSALIQSIIRNQGSIQEENQQFLARLAAEIDRTLEGGTDPEALDEYQRNISSLVNQIIQQAASELDLNEDEVSALLTRATPASAPGQDERQQTEQQRAREQQQQAREQQAQQAREQQQQSARELVAKIEEQKRQQEEANQRAAEEQRRKAEEALRQRQEGAAQQGSAGQDQDSAQQANTRSEGANDGAQRLRERLLASGGASPNLNPSAPATPASLQNHLNSVSGTGGGAVADGPGTSPDSSDAVAGTSRAGETPGDVHTDYASQERQNSAVASAADDYLASEPKPEPEPGIDPETLWASYLANNDGPYTEEFPTESIYGETVGIYNGLVRGSFENGPSANGTIQMSISFTDYQAVGSIHFDDNQGAMQFDGWVGHTGFELGMEGNAFGGSARGYLYGRMYGPNGEEIGGDWGMDVFDGEFADRFASGKFAAKQ